MVTKQQIADAAFWGAEAICLNCGAVAEEGEDVPETCEACGAKVLVNPETAKMVTEYLVDEEDL